MSSEPSSVSNSTNTSPISTTPTTTSNYHYQIQQQQMYVAAASAAALVAQHHQIDSSPANINLLKNDDFVEHNSRTTTPTPHLPSTVYPLSQPTQLPTTASNEPALSMFTNQDYDHNVPRE